MKSKKRKDARAKTCETDKTPSGFFYTLRQPSKEVKAAYGLKNWSLYEMMDGVKVDERDTQQVINATESINRDYRTKPIAALLAKGMLEKHVLHRQSDAARSKGRMVDGEWKSETTMTYTVESMTHRFTFELSKPINLDDIQIIATGFLRTRDRIIEEGPDYKTLWEKTGELDATERTARNSAETAKASAITAKALEQLATGTNRQKRKKKNPRMTATNPNGAGRTRESPDLDAFLLRAWNAYANDKTIEVEGQRSLEDFFQKSYWKKMTDFKTHETAFKKYVMKENRAEDRVKAIRKHIGREKTDRRMKRIKSF